MPLIGVVCDSENPEYAGEKLSFDACLLCARRSGSDRWCHAPYALINGMASNSVERKDAGLSTTMLLDPCARRVILQQTEDYYESPKAYWARFRGTIGHLMMEQYDGGGDGIIQEVRFKKAITIDIDGEEVEVEITGKMDHVDENQELIIDYKSIKSINAQPVNRGQCKPEHAEQVSIYRWLLWGGTNMETGDTVQIKISKAGIIYFDMSGVRKIGAPLMSLDETEAFVRERVEPFARFQRTGELPDLWYDDRGYRHRWCDYCPVREICDRKAEEGE